LFYVNFSDPARRRIPKDSAFIFTDIVRTRHLPRALVEVTRNFEEEEEGEEVQEEKKRASTSTAAGYREILVHYIKAFVFMWLVAVVNFTFRS